MGGGFVISVFLEIPQSTRRKETFQVWKGLVGNIVARVRRVSISTGGNAAEEGPSGVAAFWSVKSARPHVGTPSEDGTQVE